MSRYSGSHRSNSVARSTKIIAGLTTAGAMVAAPVMMADTANAASSSTWDKLAQCESGGNWSINTGNGYHGGVQFSPSTWRAFGGGAYASQASRASRSQQIAIAEKVLDAQGWNAWPGCSRKLGLGRSDAKGTPAVSRSSQRQAPKVKAVKQSRSTKAKSNNNRSARKSASTLQAPKSTQAAVGQYVVKAGDTLSEIAAAYKVSGGWQALFLKNKQVVGSNPNLIQVGQQLTLVN